ncbi:MAG TPA: hypothetical protein VNE86_01345 [Nitrososphaerales archaeon]|nr:hypothetical protein [Nitrososphaerales archaeon]
MTTKKKGVISQIENRKHNLAVVQEAIEADSRSAEKLYPVRDFLSQRIELLERELAA